MLQIWKKCLQCTIVKVNRELILIIRIRATQCNVVEGLNLYIALYFVPRQHFFGHFQDFVKQLLQNSYYINKYPSIKADERIIILNPLRT